MWNERYSTDEYVYGTEPNTFLSENFHQLPSGKVLCLAEGEGRNGVFLARQGYDVMAVDASGVGLTKAHKLASEYGVSITSEVVDLADYDLGVSCWEGVVAIFSHLPAPLRAQVHHRVVEALKPGGVLLLEAYTPAQLGRGTGGPPDVGMLMSAALLEQEFAGLEFVRLQELERDVVEGKHHTGLGSVVQVIARKPV